MTIYSVNGQDSELDNLDRSIENYQNYLIENPTSPHIISITDSLRQMWDTKNIKNFHCFCYCNCIDLLVNSKNEIKLENKKVSITELKDALVVAIDNPENLQNLPEKEIIKPEYFGDFVRSKGIVDILTQNANPEFYSKIIEITKSAFDEIRERWAKYFFDKDYFNLDEDLKGKLDDLLPYKIRFERYMPSNLRLPPPPAQKIGLEGIPDNEK